MTSLVSIVRDVQRELSAPRPHRGETPIVRPVSRPRYPGDPFWAGERLESAMREAGVSPEGFRRTRKVCGRGKR